MSDRYERGRRRQASLATTDDTRTRVYSELDEIAPDLTRLATEFAYGDIHTRPGLDADQRELVIIGALTALGDSGVQLRAHVHSALGAGMDRQGVVEAVMQTIPYVGFPRAIQAMLAVRAAFQDQQPRDH